MLVTSKRIEIECKTASPRGKREKGDFKNQSNRRKADRLETWWPHAKWYPGRDPEIEKDIGRKTGEIWLKSMVWLTNVNFLLWQMYHII